MNLWSGFVRVRTLYVLCIAVILWNYNTYIIYIYIYVRVYVNVLLSLEKWWLGGARRTIEFNKSAFIIIIIINFIITHKVWLRFFIFIFIFNPTRFKHTLCRRVTSSWITHAQLRARRDASVWRPLRRRRRRRRRLRYNCTRPSRRGTCFQTSSPASCNETAGRGERSCRGTTPRRRDYRQDMPRYYNNITHSYNTSRVSCVRRRYRVILLSFYTRFLLLYVFINLFPLKNF